MGTSLSILCTSLRWINELALILSPLLFSTSSCRVSKVVLVLSSVRCGLGSQVAAPTDLIAHFHATHLARCLIHCFPCFLRIRQFELLFAVGSIYLTLHFVSRWILESHFWRIIGVISANFCEMRLFSQILDLCSSKLWSESEGANTKEDEFLWFLVHSSLLLWGVVQSESSVLISKLPSLLC